MVNQQILDLIKQQLKQGEANDKIKNSLLANGWESSDIDEAISITNATQTPTQVKKQRVKKIVLIIIGVTALLIIALLLFPRFLNLFARDIAPIDDSDLSLKMMIVSNDQNAFFDLIRLENVKNEPEGKAQVILDMLAGKLWDAIVVEEIVSRNIQAFDYFAEAAGKTKFQDPAFADPATISPDVVLPKTIGWRQMARLSAIKALSLAKQGKDKVAIEEALNSVNIGQKIQESQASLLEYIVAMAMKEIGLEAIQQILTTSKLKNSDLIQYAQDLSKYYKNEDGLINAFKIEYHLLSWNFDAIINGDPEILKEIIGEESDEHLDIAKKFKNNYYFQPNKTKLLFANYARLNINSVNGSCGEIRATQIPKLSPTNPAKLYTQENAIGKILHDVVATSLTNVSIKKCEEDMLVAITQTLIAIKAFKNDTNNYPASLTELIPTYLSSIPLDPFDQKSLKYSEEKKVIYSIGKDKQDSGGSIGDDWRQMLDPTFKINF